MQELELVDSSMSLISNLSYNFYRNHITIEKEGMFNLRACMVMTGNPGYARHLSSDTR